ncbi:hypothetical protein IC607_08580 [Cellulomonas sp. JH27-2]|uniref:hypothetical protein n=1 Tax=Cellulomonas sp. JH27-2 TaxID=2774139 RepID=UPI00177DB06F|nr:hypothetical protein [Cellulomonas sp. JH27-2]MBD8059022.1 hypothetical protein [Cellulomonas sp. JH27-2]
MNATNDAVQPGRTTLPAWGADRLGAALSGRPDVSAAFGSALTCDQATAVHASLWEMGRGSTASVVRGEHHRRCGDLHDWRIERPLSWDLPEHAAQTVAHLMTLPGVVDTVATAWLSPASELELVLRALGCQDGADRWVSACAAADEAWAHATGIDIEETP